MSIGNMSTLHSVKQVVTFVFICLSCFAHLRHLCLVIFKSLIVFSFFFAMFNVKSCKNKQLNNYKTKDMTTHLQRCI